MQQTIRIEIDSTNYKMIYEPKTNIDINIYFSPEHNKVFIMSNGNTSEAHTRRRAIAHMIFEDNLDSVLLKFMEQFDKQITESQFKIIDDVDQENFYLDLDRERILKIFEYEEYFRINSDI